MEIIVWSKGEPYTVLVDEEDYTRIVESGGRVGIQRSKCNIYARITLGRKNQRQLHRWLLNPPEGMDVDHWDGNGLNNQRSNLRIVTRSKNLQNKRKTRGSSEYKGVSWHRQSSKWLVHIKSGGRYKHLGVFIGEEDAAKAYDSAARLAFGEFAALNFPVDGERSCHGDRISVDTH